MPSSIECGKQRHIKANCPTYLKKQQGGDKKRKKSFKKRRAYIAWDDNDVSSSSDLSEEEEANLCLMADIDEDETKSNVSDFSSKSNINYDNLLDVLKELHEEAQRLSFVIKTLKGLVRWCIEKLTTLPKEVHDLKKEKVDLEKSIEDSICKCKI